jgi:hypothetical protein
VAEFSVVEPVANGGAANNKAIALSRDGQRLKESGFVVPTQRAPLAAG